jgi:hypothetical protein
VGRRGVPEGGPAGRPAAISYLGLPARPSAQKNARCPAPSQVSLSLNLPARPSAQKNARCPAPSQVSLSFFKFQATIVVRLLEAKEF